MPPDQTIFFVGGSNWRQRPQRRRLVRARAQEREVCRVPPTGNDLVLVRRDDDARQRRRQVALQVRQHDLVVVAGGQQVEGVRREPDRPYFAGMRPEKLDDSTSTDVVEDAGGVLVAGHQQPARGIDRAGRDRRAENKILFNEVKDLGSNPAPVMDLRTFRVLMKYGWLCLKVTAKNCQQPKQNFTVSFFIIKNGQ